MSDKCRMNRANRTTLERFVSPVALRNSHQFNQLNSGNTHFLESNPNRINDKQDKTHTPTPPLLLGSRGAINHPHSQ